MRRYLALARLPRGPRLLVGSLLIAPGQAALDLVILLALRRASGSLGPGGVAVALTTFGFLVATVVQGRLIDRVGARRGLLPAVAAVLVAGSALIAALSLGAATWLLIALCGLLGFCVPAAGPAVRGAWAAVAPDESARTAAFSYCSLTQDAGYIAGPALFGLLADAATPTVSLGCCALLLAAGAAAIASGSPNRRPAAERTSPARLRQTWRTLLPVTVVITAVGVSFGAIDVSAPALATQHGRSAVAGILIAATALGSMLGGFVYGARSWTAPPAHRLRTLSLVLAVLLVLPAVAGSPAAAVPALFVAGLPLGPAMTTAYLLGDELVAGTGTVAGLSLLTVALNGGAAAGYIGAAQLAAHHPAAWGFVLGSAGGIAAALAATRAVRATG